MECYKEMNFSIVFLFYIKIDEQKAFLKGFNLSYKNL